MKNIFKIIFIIFLFCSSYLSKVSAQNEDSISISLDTTTIPHLARRGEAIQLMVDGMIRQARKNHLHLILLWFGSWKNGQSYYAPAWVKKDQKRFPLVKIKSGRDIDILSPLSRNTLHADANAFATLMKHIKKIDGAQHTVIMMQVENEVGVFGDSRDRSQLASENYNDKVPAQLLQYLQAHKDHLRKNMYDLWSKNGFKTSGNWTDIFGAGAATDEVFMAWQYAYFINQVAKAGKAAYALPMYVNAWIVQPNDKGPGDYPSGGPQAHVHDIWKAAAPDIDILAPDIYLNDFPKITAQYEEAKKPLFIPESFSGGRGAANAFYAVGARKALGYSPFGIEDIVRDSVGGLVSKAYDVLAQLKPLLLKAQQEGIIKAVSLNKNHAEQKVHFGNYILDIERRHPWRSEKVAEMGYALIISTAPDEYYVAGNNFQITFFPDSGSQLVGFEYVEDGSFTYGKWQVQRRLNGDAITGSLKLAKMAAQSKTGTLIHVANGPSIRKVKVYQF